MKLRILLLLLCSFTAHADTLSNSNTLFNFAEQSYPELFSPPQPGTGTSEGYYYRYYANTKVYLGTRGDQVYALGGPFGAAPVYGGRIRQFVTLSDADISDRVFTSRLPLCSYYADQTYSAVRDIKRNTLFTGTLTITVDGDDCVFSSNNIPNHDFNDSSAAFATQVSAVSKQVRVPIEPVFASATTAISLTTDNAIFLNGVKLDLLAAACFGVGDEKIGCNNMSQPWRFDPMSSKNNFGTDQHNAHTQPDGAYHYHGNPMALFSQSATAESGVIGFAADGFPIFGSYINVQGQIRQVSSSYRLKSGNRPTGNGNPGGTYDGKYVDDYEYVAGLGDLDQCNGMMRDGVYGYYVTNSYPWVMACFKGKPDSSFNKTASGGSGQNPPPGGPPGG